MTSVRPAIEQMMRKERIGVISHLILSTLAFVYGAGVRLRYLFYRIGVLKSKKLPCKVISIGNITVGGTGKTPMAIFVAEFLKKSGKKVVILSRGYRKKGGGGVVSDGREIRLGPGEAGDEPYLMARRLKDVPVIAGADRFRSGECAIKEFAPEFIILDDGFQHLRLKRDINILLMDSDQGLGNGLLLPRGILREPAAAIKRADFIMVKGKGLRGTDEDAIKKFNIPALAFDFKPSGLYDIFDNTDKGIGFLKGKKVMAFAGVANPGSFFKTLESMGAVITNTISFPDHHAYTASDMKKIRKAKGGGVGGGGAEIIVTTEKDGVKLKDYFKGGLFSIYALGIDVAVEDEEGFKRLFTPAFDRRGRGEGVDDANSA